MLRVPVPQQPQVEMATESEQQTLDPNETQTSTLAEVEPDRCPEDVEKQQVSPSTEDPGEPYPDGGLKAWATVVGAWLAGKFLFSFEIKRTRMILLTPSQFLRLLDMPTHSVPTKHSISSKGTPTSQPRTSLGSDLSNSFSNSRSGRCRGLCTIKGTFIIS